MNDFQQVKFEIFIPEAYIERLQEALHTIGVGRIGNYDHCLSITEVRGTWRPLSGSQPYVGEVGQISQGTECKVEVNCPREKAASALALIRQVHPYDEPLINIVPLVNHLFEADSDFLAMLSSYLAYYPEEADTVARVRNLVQTHPDAFERTCAVGHITGSAWIVTADRQRCLLTHHRKLDRWLQLGGHVDGERRVHLAALREAQEESGMMEFSFVELGGQVLPFDIDIHGIPATATEPGHEHYDLRYLLIAAEDQPLQISTESKDLRWFTWSEIEQVQPDESMRRMARKAKQLLFGKR